MALAYTLGVDTPSTLDGTTFDTASFSPATDDILLVLIYSVKATASDVPAITKVSGTATLGTIHDDVERVTQTVTNFYRVTAAWVRCTAGGTLVLRATFAGTQTGCMIVVTRFSGADLTNPIRQSTNNQDTASRPTYSLTGTLASSMMVAADSIARNPPGWTTDAGANWTERIDSGLGTPAHGYYLATSNVGDDSYLASAGTNGGWRGIYLEIRAAGPLFTVQSDLSVTATPGFSKQAKKVMAAVAVTDALTAQKNVVKAALSGGSQMKVTAVVGFSKQVTKVMADITLTDTLAMVKSIVKAPFAVSLTATLGFLKTIVKAPFAVSVTDTLGFLKTIVKAPFALVVTDTLAFVKNITKPSAVSVTATPGFSKRVVKTFAVALTDTLTFSKQLARTFALGVTATPAFVKQIVKAPFAVSSTETPGFSKQVTKVSALGVTATPGVTKKVTKLLALGVTATLDFTYSLGTRIVTVALSLTATPGFQKAVTKVSAVSSSMTLAVRRAISKAPFAVSVTVTPGFFKAIAKKIGLTLGHTLGFSWTVVPAPPPPPPPPGIGAGTLGSGRRKFDVRIGHFKFTVRLGPSRRLGP